MLLVSETECDAAAVYTKNLVCGAPITVTRQNLANGKARAVICNSGFPQISAERFDIFKTKTHLFSLD